MNWIVTDTLQVHGFNHGMSIVDHAIIQGVCQMYFSILTNGSVSIISLEVASNLTNLLVKSFVRMLKGKWVTNRIKTNMETNQIVQTIVHLLLLVMAHTVEKRRTIEYSDKQCSKTD